MTTTSPAPPATFGDLLRTWRQRRHLTQLALSGRAEVSARHLSFVETGRATPSRDMVLHLAEHLDVPLRERNALLVAAGYAPTYPERGLDAPALRPIRTAIDRLLEAHEPYPAVVLNRWYELIAANASALVLVEGIAPHLLEPPINILRAALHPDGLAPRIRNLGAWRAHLLARLDGQLERSGDPKLAALAAELGAHDRAGTPHPADPGVVAIPLILATDAGDLHLISTIATFGTPLDVTVEDLSIEALYPADEATRERLVAAARARASAAG
jgi:transcriptional regulator with XRE-family HTH domain